MKHPNVISLDAHKAFNSHIEQRKIVEQHLGKYLEEQKRLQAMQNKKRR